jgi:hypothetical protein
MSNPAIAKFQNAPKQFLEIALKRAGAGQSFKTNSDFLQPKRLCSTTRARSYNRTAGSILSPTSGRNKKSVLTVGQF